jgi:hypothetical protein
MVAEREGKLRNPPADGGGTRRPDLRNAYCVVQKPRVRLPLYGPDDDDIDTWWETRPLMKKSANASVSFSIRDWT